MSLPSQPKKMIVVGSGAIGVEFAHFYNAMGTEVTIVEFLPNVVFQGTGPGQNEIYIRGAATTQTNISVSSVQALQPSVAFY